MPNQTPAALREGAAPTRHDRPLINETDLYLFAEGTLVRAYEKLGAHVGSVDGTAGVHFAVWAPNAGSVHIVGSFNAWNPASHPLQLMGHSGVWQGFIPGVQKGDLYKYHIVSKIDGYTVQKADPYGVQHQTPPQTASVVWDLEYTWNDAAWMQDQKKKNALNAPISVYEMHLGSWARVPEEANRSLTYRELAPKLIAHLNRTGYTHVEFMPAMEHPFFGSWGYQCTGFFAPSSRYGTPQDLMFLIDSLHQAGYGVILDWVPSHFPTDEHGIQFFDGSHLYEHADPRQGHHPDWNSSIFNYGRHEVRSFLLSSAYYWLGMYHADGLRVDAVASMLYLDYSRKAGEWIPNEFGGRENLESIAFLRRMNDDIHKGFPAAITIAEESTAWPMVTRPSAVGGLGFNLKWDMGWMHDTLHYMALDPVFRKFNHSKVTFRLMYAFSEAFMLPLSHDEVVHGKGSLLGKMPGDAWNKMANLRLLIAAQMAQPAKKLLFMGQEFGQLKEWNHDSSLDWHLLDQAPNAALMKLVHDLNMFYRTEKSMHEMDCEQAGFEWIDCNDADQSIVSLMRKSRSGEFTVIVLNFTPVIRENYRVGVLIPGDYIERINSDAHEYGGSGVGNMGKVTAADWASHKHHHSILLRVPPMSALFLTPAVQPKPQPKPEEKPAAKKLKLTKESIGTSDAPALSPSAPAHPPSAPGAQSRGATDGGAVTTKDSAKPE